LRELGYTAALVLERVISRGTPRARSRTPGWILALIAVLAAAGILIGCGGGGDSTSGNDDSLPPNVISDSDIDAQEGGSASQALLQWWQAFQFSDAQQVIDRTSKETLRAVGQKNLSGLVQAQGQGLQKIEILGEDDRGDTASVRVGLLQFQPPKEGAPPPDEPTSSTPDTFEMKDEDGEWKFAATDYLEPKIDSFKQSQKAQQQPTTTSTTTDTGKSG
jgi:hypothetical protein